VLARALAELCGAASGVVTASGMASATVVVQLLAPGDVLVAPHDCYGGMYRLLTSLANRGAFELRLADLSDPNALAAELAARPKMLWIETPSNPLLRVTDIAAAVALARESGTRVVVDNTFLTPALQRPLELGADIVIHSTTKYLNGHSDVVGGAVLARDPEVGEELAWWANCLGVTGAPFDSFLTLRGLRTLFARMRIHEQNARRVADFLAAHPRVVRVYYPGLAEHPGHDLAARQQSGFGGMLSFELDGGAEQVGVLLDRLQLFSLAESLGGVESLVAHPATMTHAAMDPEARRAAGIEDRLLRLSIGIEDPEDLVADLSCALDRVSDNDCAGTEAVTRQGPAGSALVAERG